MKSRKVTIGSELDLLDVMALEQTPKKKTRYTKIKYIEEEHYSIDHLCNDEDCFTSLPLEKQENVRMEAFKKEKDSPVSFSSITVQGVAKSK